MSFVIALPSLRVKMRPLMFATILPLFLSCWRKAQDGRGAARAIDGRTRNATLESGKESKVVLYGPCHSSFRKGKRVINVKPIYDINLPRRKNNEPSN
jgi:hypothetical protein